MKKEEVQRGIAVTLKSISELSDILRSQVEQGAIDLNRLEKVVSFLEFEIDVVNKAVDRQKKMHREGASCDE